MHTIDEWNGCYPSQWKGLIVPQAMSHPAKFSSRLIRRIYDHMLEEGWLRIGDRVLDPFGGVALGAMEAMRHGLRWQGIELEAKFVDLGTQNIDLWDKKFSRMPHWGSARLSQGDSRFILKVLGGDQQALVSSPPYAETRNSPGGNNMDDIRRNYHGDGNYGITPGQLGKMNEGDFSAAITSPPFRQSEGGTPEPKPGGPIDDRLYARHAAGNSAADGYGTTPGNLANMDEPNGDFAGAISSPPFEKGSEGVLRADKFKDPEAFARVQMNKGHGSSFEAKMRAMINDNDRAEYGDTEGNIGNDSGETFWQAARQIVEQVYLALAPGGHAVWVVKNYVKNKQIVPFCDQWRLLCESVGFVTLHEHHAMLVHKKGTSHTLEGGTVDHKTESKSFFRRLAEKNGSPRIDYETVFCMVKPK